MRSPEHWVLVVALPTVSYLGKSSTGIQEEFDDASPEYFPNLVVSSLEYSLEIIVGKRLHVLSISVRADS